MAEGKDDCLYPTYISIRRGCGADLDVVKKIRAVGSVPVNLYRAFLCQQQKRKHVETKCSNVGGKQLYLAALKIAQCKI